MQVLLKQQQFKNRLRAGDMSDERGSRHKKHKTPPDLGECAFTPSNLSSFGFGQQISSQEPMMPSLASLCSYDDDSDTSECIVLPHQDPSTSVLTLEQGVESSPAVAAMQSNTGNTKYLFDARVRSKSVKVSAAKVPIHQSKVLARTGRCNLLEKLLQKEANADMRTILLCFRAFATRSLV
jgi:hypothetical protein